MVYSKSTWQCNKPYMHHIRWKQYSFAYHTITNTFWPWQYKVTGSVKVKVIPVINHTPQHWGVDIHDVGKLLAQTLRSDRGDQNKIYCQGTICQRCVLAALQTVKLGLTKVGNQAKPRKYSLKKLYFIPIQSRCSNVWPPTSIQSWWRRSRD